MEREKLITAEEAQSILDVCETMARVASQMGLTTLLMGGDEPSLMDAIPGLARTVKALHAEVARRGAIIEGRTTPPSSEEIDAHAIAGGAWLVTLPAVKQVRAKPETRYTDNPREVSRLWWSEGARWIPVLNGRPTTWPVVPQ